MFFLLGANWLSGMGQNSPKAALLKRSSVNGKLVVKYPLSASARQNTEKAPFFSSTPKSNPAFQRLSPDYYTKCLGLFCRVELQVEKQINIPLRLRIGSLDYLNKLEGKR